MAHPYSSTDYSSYLAIPQILNAQHPRSAELGTMVHDEMLFIIIHQVYELWFKQIIFEVGSIHQLLSQPVIQEADTGTIVHRLHRVTEIQKLLIDQMRILETMPSLDFLEFRDYIIPASGFQSFQFRLLEATLGLSEEQRVGFTGGRYFDALQPNEQEQLKHVVAQPSLFAVVDNWLARMPFVKRYGYDFAQSYQAQIIQMMDNEREMVKSIEGLDEQNRNIRLKMLDDNQQYMLSVLVPQQYQQLKATGKVRLSYDATIAALMIGLYRHHPILQGPFQFLRLLIEMDELLTSWRFKHGMLVLKIIGRKMGTGGSSGFDYLMETVAKHRVFEDLYNLSTLYVASSKLPPLPDELAKEMGFAYR